MTEANNSMAANLVATRGNRTTAAILGFMEDEVYTQVPQIPTSLQRQIRQVVLDQINAFKDLAIDIVKSDTALMNQVWVSKLDEIHQDLKRMRDGV
jgi:hypothetical protein